MLVGLDVGGTKALAVLIEAATGEVIDRDRRSSAGPGPTLVSALVELVSGLVEANHATLDAVGLGVAGLAHRSGVVHYSPNLPDLVEFPIGPAVQEALGVPVIVCNDATAGAWAEAKLGSGRGTDDFIFVALGTGIGTGFVVNGRLLTGAHGFAGESGHMVVDAHGPTHHTGQQGPWEYFASGTALGEQGRTAAGAGRFDAGIELAGSIDAITGHTVAEALERGDDQAAVIFDGFCREVARGLANLVLILDPQRIVIGGGLADIGEPLRTGVHDWLHRLLLGVQHRPRVEVVMAEMGQEAGAVGAGLIVTEHLDTPPTTADF